MSVTHLEVFVGGKEVATLGSEDGFAHHLTYRPDAKPEDFVSLVMPVRPETWSWPTLHPFFQVNLPEGFLLSELKQQLGPHLGSRPLDLLAVVGQNSIGRVQLAPSGGLTVPGAALDLTRLLHGERSFDVFIELLHTYAASGVSGVVPKFLSPQAQALFRKGSLKTERHIIKGSSATLPYLALNEHLGMQVAARAGAAAARTQVSDDGQVLVVERFDVAEQGARLGFEDCCSLLGLAPEDKYNATWERVARLVGEFVPAAALAASREQLALTLLLTYALGNADCHTKNLALLYSNENDVRLAPVYDMLTILAYDSYAENPPGMYVGGRKSWMPGKALGIFLQQCLGFEPPRQRELVDRVLQSVSDTFSELLGHIRNTPGFAPVGARMVREWANGIERLSDRASIAVPNLLARARGEEIAPAAAECRPPNRIGESPLRGRRGRIRPAS
jgi:serine/threonine-protein kinase HipA